MEAGELLDMLRGAVQPDVEEVGFVPGHRDTGQCPDLGVAELALGQRLGEQRQLGQRPGDTHLLTRRVGVDAAGPAQPVGAGQRPLRGPDLAAVELGDEDKQSGPVIPLYKLMRRGDACVGPYCVPPGGPDRLCKDESPDFGSVPDNSV